MSATVARPGDRGTAARELLAALYPAPLSVAAGSQGRRTRAAWTAIPSAESPRLLVPVARPTAATRMMRRQLTGRRLRTRVARTGLSLAMSSGALMLLPRTRVTVSGPQDAPSIEEPLRRVLGIDELFLTMPVGPARSNRKPVLQVADRSGRVHAFVKVGHNALTAALVCAEGAALRRLGSEPTRVVRMPRALACLTWEGREVLVLEPLDIPTRRLVGPDGDRRLLDVVRAISAVGGRREIEWRVHPYRSALLERLATTGALADRLRRQVEQGDAGLLVPTGAWHGDLNSGNIALVDGPCPVWDWERFEEGVPVGFDLLHHELHRSVTTQGVAPRTAAERLIASAPSILAPLGVALDAAALAARAYLVTLACRYLADDQEAAGADLGRVQDWLLPALEEVPA